MTVLTTSREPLGIPGEWVHVVAPLDPATEGVELFCDRAVAADEAFTPSADDRVAITSICRHLDGMPLAIELAAARIRSSTPADLLSRLDDRFRLLRRSGRGGPPRHQTLRATVDWSYQLLDDDERLFFDRCSAFAGGFDLAAAEAVCADGLERPDIAGMLDSLVAKSMVIVDRSRHGVRYGLLETLRQYGEERLRCRGETSALRDRHLSHYLEGATRARELWASPRQLEAHTIFDHEWDNLRAAHSWSVLTADTGRADALVAATGPHAWCRLNHEHGDWASQAMALATVDRPVNPATYGWAAYWGSSPATTIGPLRSPARASTRPRSRASRHHLVLGGPGVGAPLRRSDRPGQGTGSASRDRCRRHRGPFAQSWAHSVNIEEAFTSDRAAFVSEVTQYGEWADGVGAPSLLSEGRVLRAR